MPPLQGPRAPLCWMRYPVNTSMRPSSIRTGTSTWTSRNGCIRTCRMYCSRLIRLAARSNWLATMDFPDIVRDAGPVGGAVTAPPLDSGDLEAAAGQATRRVESFGEGVSRVDLAGATPAGVGEHADHVGAPPRAGRLARLLQDEHEAGGMLRHGAGDGTPPGVRGLRALGHDEGTGAGVEAGAGDERGAERGRQGAPHGEGRPQRDDLAEAPPRIARQVEKCGRERRVIRDVAGGVGREHDGAGFGEPALRRGQLVRAARRVKRVAAGGGGRPPPPGPRRPAPPPPPPPPPRPPRRPRDGGR